MKVISILNQKGGSGKTTISTNLASALHLKQKKVILIDSDPQGSAMDWYAANESNPIETYSVDKPILEKATKKLKCDYVIIDGAPHVDDLAISAIKASDLILIPVQPSKYDIWASEKIIRSVKNRIEMTDGKLKAYFVISRVMVGTKIAKKITNILGEFGLPVLDSRTYDRIIYSTTIDNGISVIDDDPKCKAALEMGAIADEVINICSSI